MIKRRLGLLLTGGIECQDGAWIPTSRGVKRCEKMIELYDNGSVRAIAIIGGKREKILSEAEVYKRYLIAKYPEIADDIVIVDAHDVCTNRDIIAALPAIDKYLESIGCTRETIQLEVVTYWDHFYRAYILLSKLGFEAYHVSSGEGIAYRFRVVEWSLIRITEIDPEWRLLGAPLAALANRQRLKQEKQ